MDSGARHRIASAPSRSSHRTHGNCQQEAEKNLIIMEELSTEEIFLECQRCELEIELAALTMIFSSIENGTLEAAKIRSGTKEEKEVAREVAPKEHIPHDKDCASLHAQLEQLRLQLSEADITVDE